MKLNDLTPDELRALRRQVGDVARERIDAELARRSSEKSGGRRRSPEISGDPETPVHVVVGWEFLISKNPENGESRIAHGIRWSAAVREARAKVGEQVAGVTPVFEGPVHVEMYVFPPNRRWDALNFVDGLMDALQGAVLRNDRQLGRLLFVPGVDAENPRAEITVRSMERLVA